MKRSFDRNMLKWNIRSQRSFASSPKTGSFCFYLQRAMLLAYLKPKLMRKLAYTIKRIAMLYIAIVWSGHRAQALVACITRKLEQLHSLESELLGQLPVPPSSLAYHRPKS